MKIQFFNKNNLNIIFIFILILMSIAEFAYLITSQKNDAYEASVKSAIENAERTAGSISALRSYYTNNIVAQVKTHSILNITHNYKERQHDSTGAIPLPATFAIEYAKEISDRNTEVRLVSEFPFHWRRDRKYSQFDKKAEQLFKGNKDSLKYIEIDHANHFVYYAVPDKMSSPTCVNCHNSHPDSPKKDWMLGDVRGVISIAAPITNTGNAQGGTIAVIFLTVFALSVFLYLTFNRTQKSIKNISEGIELLNKGKLLKSEIIVNDEKLVPVAAKVTNLSEYLQESSSFAEKIGKGDFKVQFSNITEDDNLKNALLLMRDSLAHADAEDKKRNWATEGLAKFGEILRSDNDNLQALGSNILSNLVKYLKANQGALFIVNDNNTAENHLELVSCYAWDRKKYLNIKIGMGEGLIGQVWQEGEYIYMTDVPDEFVRITSGLGEANPRSILIMPLKVNDIIYGVLEIASFTAYEKHEIEFVQKLSESIASTISAAKTNERTKRLLHESQQQSEELKSQEEEMKQNMEEMATTQEEMQRTQEEMKAINTITNNVAIVSKTDLRGNINYVNDEFLKWAKYTREEIMGKNHRILKSGHQPDEIFVEMWKTISSGKVFRGEIKNKAKDGSYYWVDAVIAPILDANGKPKEYLAQRFVINDKKEKEKIMETAISEMKAQEEELKQNMEEMATTQEEMQRTQDEMKAINTITNNVAIVSKTDLRGNITYVNDEFLKWAKYTREELMGKNHRILKSGHQPDEIFVEMWKTISSGKVFRGEIKNKAKDGSYYWVDAVIAPILDANGKPKEYLAQRFVINDKKEKEKILETAVGKVKDLEKEVAKTFALELKIEELEQELQTYK